MLEQTSVQVRTMSDIGSSFAFVAAQASAGDDGEDQGC